MILDPENNFIRAITGNCDISGKTILEIGCGAGRITRDLAGYAVKVVAIDPEENSLRKAKESVSASNVELLEGFGEKLEFDKESFDIVVYSLSLHHIPIDSMQSSLKQASKILRDDGRIIIIEPGNGGSIIEAEIKFGIGDGDERAERKAAIEVINSVSELEVLKKADFETLFIFDDKEDFYQNQFHTYNEAPEELIRKIDDFLEENADEGKIILRADRVIWVLKKK